MYKRECGFVREREGGSSTIQNLYLGFAEISIFGISFLNARPAKIPPKNQEAREANFAKYFPPNPQHFAKFRSRSAFLHSASFPPKTLWRSAERSPALLLQQKLCASHRGASARGERLWIFSRIFDKVGSSGIV